MDQPSRTPTGQLFRYGAGQLGAQIFRDTPAVLLPLFMTTMLGVQAWMAGLVVLVPKLWVLFCDPMVGAWSDRVSRTVGRGPFLTVGALGSSIGFGALFLLMHYPSPVIAAVSLCLIYLLASTAFSCFSVPYLALPAEMSADPHERTRILAYRMAFVVGGVIMGVGVAQPLVFHFGGGLGWHMMAGLFAAVCLVSMMTSATGRYGHVTTAQPQTPTLADQVKAVAANPPFCILLATSFVQALSQASSYTVIGFFYLYVIGNVNIILPMVLCMSTFSLISQPMWVVLSRRFGKERCFYGANIVFIAVTISWAFAHKGNDVLATLPVLGPVSTQDALVLVRAVVIGLTNAGFLLLTLSMLTDTIQLSQRGGGVSTEGIFSGLYSALEKLAFATGPTLAGVILSACGFVASTGGAMAQSPRVIFGVLMIYSLIPAALIVVSLLIFTRYHGAVRRKEATFHEPSAALSR
jgi:GPH family glycoside/pentoside/hexuronide:cation symporter